MDKSIITEEQARQHQLSRDEIDLIKNTIAKGSTDNELKLFIKQCDRTQLDPFARQIYSIRRKQWDANSHSYTEAQVIQVSIDGFRLIADRTGKYAGQVGPWWCDKSGEWREVWLEDEPPAAAKVGVLRHDFHQPIYSIAPYKSYVQVNGKGEPVSRWKTDPAGMLAKCAEALALRRAFPQDLSGLYTTEEMGQADKPDDALNVQWMPTTPALPEQSTQEPEFEPPSMVDTAEALGATVTPLPDTQPKREVNKRPFTPDELRKNFNKAVATIEAKGLLLGPDDFRITEQAASHLLDSENDLHHYLNFVTGIPYLEDMNEAQVIALLRLLKPVAVSGTYIPSGVAVEEAKAVLATREGGAQ